MLKTYFSTSWPEGLQTVLLLFLQMREIFSACQPEESTTLNTQISPHIPRELLGHNQKLNTGVCVVAKKTKLPPEPKFL